MEIRDKLVRLSQLGIGGRVLEMYSADLDDLELIAVIEDTLKERMQEVPDEGS